jgi:transposase
MRKSIDGLAMLVRAQFNELPSNGSLYVFCNRGHDKIKILYWDRNGFCLWYKRLEQERFGLTYSASGLIQITSQQLRWLLDGLDYTKLQGHQSTGYSSYY